jgi:S1-C subfamily serine protease
MHFMLLLSGAALLLTQLATPPTGTQIRSDAELRSILSNMGYAVKAVPSAGGASLFAIIIEQQDWRLPVYLSRSGDGGRIWITMTLCSLASLDEIPRERQLEMLAANQNTGPVHFSYAASLKELRLNNIVENRSVTPAILREEIDRLIATAVRTASTWEKRNWAVSSGTPPVAPPVRPPESPPARSQPNSSGSGFLVTEQGHIVTNAHVITDCASVQIEAQGVLSPATVLATDVKNDLALLRSAGAASRLKSPARFVEGRPALGDIVYAAGFPLRGLLGGINLTSGTVSALTGPGGDTGLVQITAPVQPGNSGGPLITVRGGVAGMIVSKLNALATAKVTGDIPQNVNFAITGTRVRDFLDTNVVSYKVLTGTTKLEAAQVARQITVAIDCVGGAR